jgi:hypothetical protein
MATRRFFFFALLATFGILAGAACGAGGDASQGERESPAQQLFRATDAAQSTGPTQDNLSVMPLSAVRSLPLEGDREGAAEIAALVLPVRHEAPQPSQPILTLRYWRIRKGTFEEFYRLTVEGMWPYAEKIGARPVGTWLVTRPPNGQQSGMHESLDYHEVYMLVRYASFEHWQGTRRWARLGGNGPDWERAQAASTERLKLVLDSWVTFLEGGLHEGGPFYTPALDERYRLVESEGERGWQEP